MSSSGADLSQRLHDHAAFLRAVARRLVRDRHTADDLVQETFARALRQPPRGVASLRAWLATIVRNVWRDQRVADAARARREQAHAAPAADDGHANDPFGIEHLNAALHALPPEYRHVLQARYYAQQAPADIALATGVPLATVKSRLVRALELLRADVVARCGGERRMRLALAPLAGLGGKTALMVTGSGGLLMAKKTMSGAAAAIAIAGVWWGPALVAGDADPAPVASPVTAKALVPDTREDAVLARVESERIAAAADGDARPLGGRVLDAKGGDALPFVPVHARHGTRLEQVVTDRDGRFTFPGAWPATTRIGAPGLQVEVAARTAAPSPDARDANSSPVGTPVATGGSSLAVQPPPPPQVPPAAIDVQWCERATFGGADHVDLPVALPPTWLVRVAGAPSPLPRLGIAFVDRGSGSDTWWPAFAELASLTAIAGSEVLWCRRPLTHTGRAPELLVASEDGHWFASVPIPKTTGVVGPLDVTLTPRGVVVGTVRDRFGAPVAGATVLAAVATANGIVRAGDRTGAAGTFRLPHLPPGSALLTIVGERHEGAAERVDVVAAQTVRRDLAVHARARGGSVRGTVATTSGRVFFGCSAVLTSRGDTSIWRTAPIEWRRGADGRALGEFEFADVPVVECEVALRCFQPGRIDGTTRSCTPPAIGVDFAVDDEVATRTVRFALAAGSEADGNGAWCLHVSGDGWSQQLPSTPEGTVGARLPIGQRVSWRTCGAHLRAQRGELLVAAHGPATVVVPRVPGCSLRVAAVAITNFHPVPDLALFADGVLLGRTDRRGELWLDLPAAPRAFTLDPQVARVFRDAAHRSDVDPTSGAWHAAGSDGSLDLYIEATR